MAHRSLDHQTAKQILIDTATSRLNPSQTTAFMAVYMMRSITIEELAGFRDAMLELCHRVHFEQPVMDLCGTGGDGKSTFNISTISSFVVAAAGQPVAKHGNYGVSSPCGSSNVLEHFGFKFSSSKDLLQKSLDEANICIMHAPLFHPAMKNVAPIRKELGIKTFFNMLGPLVNPAQPKSQLIGVFNLELARQFGYLYQGTAGRYSVIHSIDGYDELSLTGPVKIFSPEGEDMVDPKTLGFERATPTSILGGETIKEAASIFLSVLQNQATVSQMNVVIANAAMALHSAHPEKGWDFAVDQAREAIASGRALQCFKKALTIQL